MHQSTKIGYNIQQYYMYVLFHFLKIAMHQVIYFANHVDSCILCVNCANNGKVGNY